MLICFVWNAISSLRLRGKSEALSSNNGIETTWGAHLKAFSSREKNSIHERIKTAFKKFFGFKEKKVVSDPPKMSETTSDAKTFALIDDFLDPETEFEDEQEDVSAEYIDFLSVGLDVSSSDVIENHGKNKSDELQTCKK